MGRNHNNTNLIQAHGRYISLRTRAPVNFDIVRPRFCAEVTTGRIEALNMLRLDSTPTPDSRPLGLPTDNPTSGHPAFGKVHVPWTDRHDGRLPEKLHPAFSG